MTSEISFIVRYFPVGQSRAFDLEAHAFSHAVDIDSDYRNGVSPGAVVRLEAGRETLIAAGAILVTRIAQAKRKAKPAAKKTR